MIEYTWQPAAQLALKPLYEANGWTAYLTDWAKTQRAIAQSTTLVAHDGDIATGLIRGVSDGETILYIQDLLVLPQYQEQGIGTHLLQQLLAYYADVGQVLLLSENSAQAKQFYQHAGLQPVSSDYGTAFVLDRRY